MRERRTTEVKAYEILKKSLQKLIRGGFESKNEDSLTSIEGIKIVEDRGQYETLEFYLENGQVFRKKFQKGSCKLKVGDKVELVVGKDHIIRDLYLA